MNDCRSEIHVPSVSLRFILILEAYCRGNIWHIKLLSRQVKPHADVNSFTRAFLSPLIGRLCPLAPCVQNEALLKMKTLSDIVKSGSQKMTVDGLKSCISHESYLEPLSDLLSPLNPSVVLTEIWLVPDIHSQHTHTHAHTTHTHTRTQATLLEHFVFSVFTESQND